MASRIIAGGIYLVVLWGLVLTPVDSIFAQETNKKTKTSTIDFEDELIQGDLKKPELLYLLRQKQFNYERLIKLRKDFLPEMRRTAEELQQGGNKD